VRGVQPSRVLAAGDLGRQHKRATSGALEALEHVTGRVSEWDPSTGARAVPHAAANVSFKNHFEELRL